ncbi:MAG: hypothetical protein Q8J64_05350 [Thermodesulfovibrionales bacterium]|nr:hypothetical protein [Thermodesulfovibrionales bacterium]
MSKDIIRMATQIILGLTLFFGTATLVPRGVLYLRYKSAPKGVLYIFMGLLCAFFSIMAFHYAYAIFAEGRN